MAMRVGLIPFLLALAWPAAAQDASSSSASSSRLPRRGPLESREEWLLAIPRPALRALSPDPLRRGRTRLRLDLDWGNDFGYQETGTRDQPITQFLVDGEHRALALEARRGITDRLGLGVRLPLRWQGGGFLDGLIDAFHGATGLPGGARSMFARNRLRVEGRDPVGHEVRWTGRPGTGLGDVELLTSWSSASSPPAPQARAWTAALVGRLALPTGTGPFSNGGVGGGAQVVSARSLGGAWDVYFGLGATASSRPRTHGIAYRAIRPEGFAALEWRPWRAWSVVVQAEGAGRLVTNLAAYPGFTAYFRMAVRLDVSPRWRVEGGFTEGIRGLDASTDFGVLAAVVRTF